MLKRMLKAASFKKAFEMLEVGKVAEGRALLEDLQAEYLTVCEENKVLKRQIIEVAEIVDLSEVLEFDGRTYWLVEDLRRKGPYCQLCYDRDGLLIRLQEKEARWKCLACDNAYERPGRDELTQSEVAGAGRAAKRVIPLFLK